MQSMADMDISRTPDEDLQDTLSLISRNRAGTFLADVRKHVEQNLPTKSLDEGFLQAVRIQKELQSRANMGVSLPRSGQIHVRV